MQRKNPAELPLTMNLKPLIDKCAICCCIIVCTLLLNSTALAQLRADFTVDKTGGCSPLVVSFTNNSSGTSSNTIYTWDFGNGNTSSIVKPSAIFTEEKEYTVTLTATDGGQRSVKTMQVTVYKKPTVDFSTNIVKGCLPLNVNFTSNSTPGSGNISSYYWDFGDGSTQQAFSSTQQHTYTEEQQATVSLTVTNSMGCHSTVVKKDIVRVIPTLKASFTADKTILCRESDPVQFINSSAGPGTLTYLWDFGDGTTSTQANPSHVFNKRGIFSVTLTVTSSEGCVRSVMQSGFINVASFNTQFTAPANFCAGQQIQFTSTSTPQASNTLWEVDGEPFAWYGNTFYYTFNAGGSHKIKLINTYGACTDSAVKQITVKQTPTTTGFIATVKGECGAPVAVDFRDTTTGAVSWKWNFDYGVSNSGSSTLQAPTHTFTENRIYPVNLQVTNAEGCTKEITQFVNLPYPYVTIATTVLDNSSGCGPVTAKFSASSTWQPITKYRWDFGNGGSSTEAEPEHVFTTPGTYQIRLHYTTSGGCTGTVHYNSIGVHGMPKADFRSVSGTTICGNTPVIFTNQTTGDHYGVNWFINDAHVGSGLFSSLEYRFENEGKYTVKLVAYNGYCTDTMEKVDYITVKPPFPDITSVTNTCEGTRGEVVFGNASRMGESYTWNFGDGSTTTTTGNPATMTHTYTQTGSYKVVLSATNGACTVKDSMIAYVMIKQEPQLTMPVTSCIGSNYSFNIRNLQHNPWPDYWNYDYYFDKLEYDDGTPYNGYMSNYYYISQATSFNGGLQNIDRSKEKIRVILQTVGFGCYDTTNFAAFSVVGPQADFDIVNNNACFNTPVTFRDETIANGTNIVERRWSFGDGHEETSTGNTVTHVYTNPGTYYVWLTVSDDKGCSSSTAQYSRYVTISGPKAAFSASGTNVPLNTTIYFYNNTVGVDANTVYEWDFGDGSTGTGYAPSHTYPVAGSYTIKLKASNAVTGCSSEAALTIIVRHFNTAFNFSKTFITSQSCPPALVRFSNTSVGYLRVSWDFGDGVIADKVRNPTHIYEKPGKYIVTLYGYGPNGLLGTHIDSVFIDEPRATLQADDLEACVGSTITLSAKADSTISYLWDFGDGHVVPTTDTFLAHQYNVPGVYHPRLLIKNLSGCSAFASMNDQVTIRPNPTVTISPADPVVCLGQGTPLQASGGVTYSWSPAASLSNGSIASPIASPAVSTEYTVEVSDDIGCKNTGTVMVRVQSPMNVSVPPDLSVCAGNSITIPASGAAIYNWINNTTGLSKTDIATPVATPATTTTYTVTGSDIHSCFTDTAEVTVRVLPLPVVNAGPDAEVQAGTPVNLSPTYSTDVIQWTWSPSKYLDCSTCPAPISTPLAQTEYTLTVKNNVGCTAKDSLLIKMICDEAKVAIPNAFTPNGDGKNDVFLIKGISIVKHMVIYNRWGQKVYERNNFIAADRSACWNGTLNGYPASPGTYVYYVEMECPTGGVFTRKGSFVLVR